MKIKASLLFKYFPWIVFIVLVVIFSLSSPAFFTLRNILNIINQNAYLMIISMGALILLISGTMDLAVGYEMALVGVVAGILNVQLQLPTALVVLFALLLGICLELLNTVIGFIIPLPSILITLAMQTIYQGLAYTISKSQSFRGFGKLYIFMGQGQLGGIPFAPVLALFCIILTAFVLNRTSIGRNVYALGGNPEAAKLSGINIQKMKLIISCFAGFFIALGAIVLTSRLGSANATYGPGSEFAAITGICLGGVSISGGKGSVQGVVAGVLTLSVISNGMQLAGLDTYAQYIIKGFILLLAFGIDVFQKKSQQRVKIRTA